MTDPPRRRGPAGPAPSIDQSAGSILRQVRQLCLALPEASERLSHGTPSFYVRGRQFVSYWDNHHSDGRLALWCAAPDGGQAAMVAAAPEQYFVPPYVGHRGWVGVHLNRGLSENELEAVIEDAYLAVAPEKLAQRPLSMQPRAPMQRFPARPWSDR